MAIQFKLVILVGCVCFAAIVAGQSSTPSANVPDELRLNPNNPTDNVYLDSNNRQQQQQQQHQVSPNDTQNKQQQQFDNQVPRLPSTPTSTETSMDSFEDNESDDQQQQQHQQQPQFNDSFDPFGLFQPRPRPNGPQDGSNRRPSLFDIIRGGMLEPFTRHQEMMDRQFQQLERQAGEGQEVSYFSRNGVSYMRTCTTKRVR